VIRAADKGEEVILTEHGEPRDKAEQRPRQVIEAIRQVVSIPMPMTCQYFFIRLPGEFNRRKPNCEWKSERVFKTYNCRSRREEAQFSSQTVVSKDD
jgi:hypothetical protein